MYKLLSSNTQSLILYSFIIYDYVVKREYFYSFINFLFEIDGDVSRNCLYDSVLFRQFFLLTMVININLA